MSVFRSTFERRSSIGEKTLFIYSMRLPEGVLFFHTIKYGSICIWQLFLWDTHIKLMNASNRTISEVKMKISVYSTYEKCDEWWKIDDNFYLAKSLLTEMGLKSVSVSFCLFREKLTIMRQSWKYHSDMLVVKWVLLLKNCVRLLLLPRFY